MFLIKKMINHDKDKTSLGYALLIYMCVVVVLITLAPFEFSIPSSFTITWSTNFADFLTNIVLFIPIGFLFKLTRRKTQDFSNLQALTLGLLLSLAVESSQAFIHGRVTSVIDVIANSLGAWLGAMVFTFVGNQLKEHRAGRLIALELPLMGLVYFLIPLMWLNGLGTGEDHGRVWFLLLLGIIGAGVICSIYIHRFKPWATIGYTELSVFAICWFVLGSLPQLFCYPLKITFFGIAVGVVVQLFARLADERNGHDKRFEIPTIKKLLPVYVIYLLLLATWPSILSNSKYRSDLIFEMLGFNARIVFMSRFIELVAAFTLLGYMVAEMRSRKNESIEKTLTWTFVIAGASAIFIEVIRSCPSIYNINALSIIIEVSASFYGAAIYRLQLAAIQRI